MQGRCEQSRQQQTRKLAAVWVAVLCLLEAASQTPQDDREQQTHGQRHRDAPFCGELQRKIMGMPYVLRAGAHVIHRANAQNGVRPRVL